MTTMRPVTPPRTWDFMLTGFLVFLQILLLVVFLLSAITFGALNTGCSAEAGCSLIRIQLGEQVCTFVPPLIAVVTIPWAIARVVRRKIGFGFALAGGLLMTIAFIAGSALLQSGIPA